MKVRTQTTLFFIRHGQTPSNKKHIRQGVQIDDYLNAQGVEQTKELGHLVKSLDLDLLFTSYLHRAEETAAIINSSLSEPISLLHDFRLRERDFGSLTGKMEDECEELLPGFKDFEKLQTYNYRPFGGENVEDVRQRALSAILDIAENYDHRNIGIVTHDGIISLLLFHFTDITRIYREQDSQKNVANTDIYEWAVDDNKINSIKSLL